MKIREFLAMEKRIVVNDVGELKLFKNYTYQTAPDIETYAEMIFRVLTTPTDQREVIGGKFIKEHCGWDTLGKHFYQKLAELSGINGRHLSKKAAG